MRFGQLEVRTIAATIISRFSLTLPEDFQLSIRQMPTISPKQGLPMTVSARLPAPAPSLSSAG
jgi:cytochrome P450